MSGFFKRDSSSAYDGTKADVYSAGVMLCVLMLRSLPWEYGPSSAAGEGRGGAGSWPRRVGGRRGRGRVPAPQPAPPTPSRPAPLLAAPPRPADAYAARLPPLEAMRRLYELEEVQGVPWRDATAKTEWLSEGIKDLVD